MRSLLAPTLVLMYHRVAAPERDTHRLCVAPDRFAAQMDVLRRHERVVPLAEARRPGRRRRVVITFDDGYADNALVARPILEGAGLPATYFIAARLVDGELSPWWDAIEHLVLDGESTSRWVEVDIAGRHLRADVGSDAARERLHRALHGRLVRLRRDEIDDAVRQLSEQLTVPSVLRPEDRFMTTDELREVAASPLIEIGAHSMTHQQLSAVTEDEQRTEIAGGRERLRQLTGCPVDTLAYPYGGRDAFNETSMRIAEESGFALACAGTKGVVRTRTNRYRLPRVVVDDWEPEEFAARLDRWFASA
jgi:peptidoglycan/xylan/chitin deacetylase (PgdA/CDA1 family)